MSHRKHVVFIAVSLAATLGWGCASSDVGQTPTAHSLHSTDPDGLLRAGPDGDFTADEDAVRLFDYFLTTEGEVTDDQLFAMVAKEIDRQLDDPAAAKARDAFAEYVAYRQESAEIMQGSDTQAIVAQLTALHRKAVTTLPGIAADLSRIERAVAIRNLMADKSARLTSADKRAELARIEIEMTPVADALADAEARRHSRVPLELRNETKRLEADNASADDIRALRVARVGAEAADRLAALDDQRADWQHRLSEYRAERSRILAQSQSAQDRNEALAQLIESSFGPREVLRVRALEGAGRLD